MGLLVSTAMVGGAAIVSCQGQDKGAGGTAAGDDGRISLELTQAPADAACLEIQVNGHRNVTKQFPITGGQTTVFKLAALPTGLANVSGKAFGLPCASVTPAATPLWISDQPVAVQIDPIVVAHVVLRLIRNGQISIGVDFESTTGGPTPMPPTPPAPGACTGGARSSQSPYLVPVAPGVMTRAIFTVGDSANLKPDGVTPYRLVGLPDGTGAFDNGDGTFTWLVNHEAGATAGVPRAHGAPGSFVSKWTVRKCDLAVLKGEDLMQQSVLWNPAATSYAAPATGAAFSRFCSADLAPKSAFFDAASAVGFNGFLFLNGEESGNEGRGMAHGLGGLSWELPRLGKFSWENSVARPAPGVATVVAGTDDSTPGQVYIYVGTKQNTGSDIDRAGLTNGTLYGVRVTGFPLEDTSTGIPSGTAFDAFSLGNVENMTGAQIDTASNAANVTRFLRPEDGAWNPNNPNEFFFVTTASFTTFSRLWRLTFVDAANPALGGKIDLLLDGTEGQRMFDNITLDRFNHVYLQEDVGNQAHNGKIWRYDIATDALTVLAEHDASRFILGGLNFLTQDEESSGIIDASDILGVGWFLLDDQAHYGIAGELVEGGQLLAIFDPASHP
ncbi:MAG: alkaline phosphatase PhoX [Pseudomonadota bacterium]